MYIATSIGGYKQKPNPKDMQWVSKNYLLDEIVDELKNGHTLSQNFKTERVTGIFTQKDRTKEGFKSTQFVFYDLDEFPCDFDELMSILKVKPTIAYTTFSHKQVIDGRVYGNRFRLIYMFVEPITSISEYQRIYDYLLNETGLLDVVDDNKKIIDANVRSGVLCCHGTIMRDDSYFICTRKRYHVEEFNKDLQNGKANIIKTEEESNIRVLPICRSHSTAKVGSEIIKDSELMDYKQFLFKYGSKLPYIDRVQKKEWIDYLWQYIDDDYFKLRYIPVTLKDGDRRRKQLHTRTMLRRVIEPSATPDILYFNLILDLNKYIDNSKDVIKKQELVKIAESAFEKDVESIAEDYAPVINHLKEYNPKSGMILMRGKYKNGGDYNKLMSDVRKKQVLALYDSTITLKENIENLIANGISISERTLRKYLGKNKHKDAQNEEIKEMIDVSQSLTWNFKQFLSIGKSINWGKLKRLYENKKADVVGQNDMASCCMLSLNCISVLN